MLDFQAFDLVLLGLVSTANVILGSIIYFGGPKSSTRKYFFYLTVSIFFFNILTYAAYNVHELAYTIWVLRLVMFSSVAFASYFFLLAANFPNDKQVLSKKQLGAVYLASGAVMLLALSPYVFQRAVLANGYVEPVGSFGLIVFGALVLFYDIGGIWILVRKSAAAKPDEKIQYTALIVGFLLMLFSIIIFNFLLPNLQSNTAFIPYSAAFGLPFVVLTTYAIIRHNLLNIRLIATEVFTFLFVVATLLELLFAQGWLAILFRSSIFILVLSFAVLLIKSVRREVEQREQLEQLSKQLEEVNVKLQEVDKAKTEFLSVASHQLRTPLTAIKGYVSMFLEGDFGELTPQQIANLRIVYDSTRRLVDLIADLLDLSRIESGRMTFEFGPVDLCSIVESVMDELSAKAKNKGLYLYFDNVNRSCPKISADADKLRQVIVNLIDNAVKYTVKGGVTVRLQRAGNELQFSVTDTGIGIKQDDQDKLFAKYFRAENAIELTHEGTGLGIYVVKKLVEAMHGKIWFKSAGNSTGTTFFVAMPIPEGKIESERVNISSLEGI